MTTYHDRAGGTMPAQRLPATRWRLPLRVWLPIGLGIAAETVSNGLRAYGLGSYLEHFTIRAFDRDVSLAGGVMVFAALAVSLSQSRAWWIALTPGQTRQRVIAGLIGALLLAISITAMASHVLEAQRAKDGGEVAADKDYKRAEDAHKDAKDAYEAVKSEYDALGSPRAVAVIQAEVQATKIDDMRIWRASQQCEDVTRPESQVACKPILGLYKEHGAAARKSELDPQLATLRATVTQKASALAAMTKPKAKASHAEGLVAGWWAWIMGLGVVAIATFGPVLFATVEASPVSTGTTASAARGRAPTKPRPAGPKGAGRGRRTDPKIIQFSDRFQEKHGRAPGGSDLMAAFPGMPKSTAYDYARRVA